MLGTPVTLASDSMQKHIMDSVCTGCYANTTYTNVSGYKKVNTLYYKKNKFGYIGTTSIYTADNSISDINLHKLFYKSPTLATLHDTIFLNVIVVHDASGASSASKRATQIKGAMKWLSTNVKKEGNYLFLGDFNTQNSSEACFQAMINPTDTITRFYEPTNKLGDWAGSPQLFANYLTQSTRRVDPGDCASTNTMTAWFDHILCSRPIMQGNKNVLYIPSSLKVIGQDGLHTGVAINDAPTNVSVPPDVLNSLFMMSEHLPVQLKLLISNSPALPIGFEYFKVSYQNNAAALQWKTNNNDASVFYEVERSVNGLDFLSIKSIPISNDNEAIYKFRDLDFINSTFRYFYRIKEVLKSGVCLYSNVLSSQNSGNSFSLNINPNPVVDRLNININSDVVTTANLIVLNVQGQIVISKRVQLNAGINTCTIPLPSNMMKGVYVMKIQSEKLMLSKVFFKQ